MVLGQLISYACTKLFCPFNPANACGELWTEQAGICSLIRQPPDRRKALVHGSSCQAQRLQVKAKSQNDSSVQGQSRLGTIPADELLHRKLVVSPRMRRAEAVEYRRFSVVQIWKLQNNLATRWPSVSFAHMSGLHVAVMHNSGVAGSLASKSA